MLCASDSPCVAGACMHVADLGCFLAIQIVRACVCVCVCVCYVYNVFLVLAGRGVKAAACSPLYTLCLHACRMDAGPVKLREHSKLWCVLVTYYLWSWTTSVTTVDVRCACPGGVCAGVTIRVHAVSSFAGHFIVILGLLWACLPLASITEVLPLCARVL